MGNGAACAGRSAKVVPAFTLHEQVDVESLVTSRPRHFPSCSSERRWSSSTSGGEYLLFLEQIGGARGHPYLRALVVRAADSAIVLVPSEGLADTAGLPGVPKLQAEDPASGRPATAEREAAAFPTAQWPARYSAQLASWYSAKSLGLPIEIEDRFAYDLHLEVWDHKTLLAHWVEPLAGLPLHAVLTRELKTRRHGRKLSMLAQSSASEPITVRFQLLDSSAVAHKRTVFFVRHAESVWNEAQSKNHFHKMAKETDHPLSARGRQQAEALRERLRPAKHAKSGNDAATAMRKSDVVYVSPLTRAVQTAVIAIGPMLTEGGHGEVVIMANAREKRNLGGMDTVSRKTGVDILSCTLEKLRLLYREQAERVVDTFKTLRYDVKEVESHWWCEGQSESQAHLLERLQEFMLQLLYSPHSSIIVVGHSHFFRAIFNRFLANEFKAQEPDLAQKITAMKLKNCGVLRLELDPARGLNDGPIVDVKAVLGSDFTKG